MIYFAKVGDQKFYREFDPSRNGNHSGELESFAKEAVDHFKLKTSRNNPKKVKVEIWTQSANSGKLVERQITTFEIMPSLPPLTDGEFAVEQAELLKKIPQEFHSFVSSYAWEAGHSDGLEQVLWHVEDLVDRLVTPIGEFENLLRPEY